jgi:hypothetical protein
VGSMNYEELEVLERIARDLHRIASYLERIAGELAPPPTFDLPGTTATITFTP